MLHSHTWTPAYQVGQDIFRDCTTCDIKNLNGQNVTVVAGVITSVE